MYFKISASNIFVMKNGEFYKSEFYTVPRKQSLLILA